METALFILFFDKGFVIKICMLADLTIVKINVMLVYPTRLSKINDGKSEYLF